MTEAVAHVDTARLAELISDGRTSEVFRYGPDGALKLLKRSTPSSWAQIEASFTASVRRLGVAAPEVREVLDLDGRSAIHFELIDGPSMWQRMLDHPRDVAPLAEDLAAVQRAIHAAGVPDGLPSLVQRLRAKLDAADELDDHDRRRALALIDELPTGAALLHGDLHPGNVLLSGRGPVVIDWFDATVGHPAADIARTHLLLQATGATDLRHLPGASIALVEELHARYANAIEHDAPEGAPRQRDSGADRWLGLRAAGRLAEQTDADVSGLLEIWRGCSAGNDRAELVEDAGG